MVKIRLPQSGLQVPGWWWWWVPNHYQVKLQLMLRLSWAVTIIVPSSLPWSFNALLSLNSLSSKVTFRQNPHPSFDFVFYLTIWFCLFFHVKFKLSYGLIDIHLIVPTNYFWILTHKKSKSYCQVKNKVERCDIVHSGCTGLCVTVQLYSLPAWPAVTVQLYSLPAWLAVTVRLYSLPDWLAGAVNNNNREFVVCWMGWWTSV